MKKICNDNNEWEVVKPEKAKRGKSRHNNDSNHDKTKTTTTTITTTQPQHATTKVATLVITKKSTNP